MGKFAGKIKALFVGAALLATASCATQFRNYGYAPSDADLANLIVGSDTRETVATAVGRPASEALLEGGSWYYVESRFRNLAYRAPQEIEREVVVISFDTRDRLANVERFGLEDGRVITLSRRVTEATTARTSFLRQLLGNLGQIGAGILG